MYKKQSAIHNVEKLSKAIELSVNFKNHRRTIDTIKPTINMPHVKQMTKNDQLSANRHRYAENSRNFKTAQISKDNQMFVRRLQKTQSVYRRSFMDSSVNRSKKNSLNASRMTKNYQKSTLQPLQPIDDGNPEKNKKCNRSASRESLNSCSSQRSIGSNYRRRTIKYQEISNENKKIASRILNPKVNKQYKVTEMEKAFAREQEFVRIRSRFSERSKGIMQSLMLDGLKMERKHLQFLPQIKSPRIASQQEGELTSSSKACLLKKSVTGRSSRSKNHSDFSDNIYTRDEETKKMKQVELAKKKNNRSKSGFPTHEEMRF